VTNLDQKYNTDIFLGAEKKKRSAWELCELAGLTIFLDLVERADMRDLLDSPEWVTVLAPINDGFAALGEDAVETLRALPKNDLQCFVAMHVLPVRFELGWSSEVAKAAVEESSAVVSASFSYGIRYGGANTTIQYGKNLLIVNGISRSVSSKFKVTNGLLFFVDSPVMRLPALA